MQLDVFSVSVVLLFRCPVAPAYDGKSGDRYRTPVLLQSIVARHIKGTINIMEWFIDVHIVKDIYISLCL